MRFASPIPWWLAIVVASALCAVAVRAYRRPLVPLERWQRATLTVLRAATLLALFALVCRPLWILPPLPSSDIVVPVLLDLSRSMAIPDADGEARLARATTAVSRVLMPALSGRAVVELFGFSDQLIPIDIEGLAATGTRSDLLGAVDAVRRKFDGRSVPGIVVVSDGGQTPGDERSVESGPPVYTVGIGSRDGVPDREVVALAAGDPRIDQVATDVVAAVTSRGLGGGAFDVRLLENGQFRESRSVTPPGNGTPVDVTFTVLPDPLQPSVYTVEVAAAENEEIVQNNRRSVVVSPALRARRVLLLSGAPGYDFTFLLRALQHDRAFEVDSVVRKGKNETNEDTFIVQAGNGRGAQLTRGYPTTKEALFAYDAVVFMNVEADFFSRAQMELTAEFVGQRGGGLLIMGSRSFEHRGVAGTPLEPLLPVEPTDRRGTLARTAGVESPAAHDTMSLTDEGARHPMMRLAAAAEESRRLWRTLPAMSFTSPLGGPRAGASLLAVTKSGSGALLPVVAVQRYGRGRSMVFTGEASWRWQMLSPAGDRRFDTFWRQAVRWLVADAPGPVTVTAPTAIDVTAPAVLSVDVAGADFTPVGDAVVDATLVAPDGRTQTLQTRPSAGGRTTATIVAATSGPYRVQATAVRGGRTLGSDERWLFAGDEREYADPRLNESFLRRLSRSTGGIYVTAGEVDRLAGLLEQKATTAGEPQQRDLWHEPWTFAFVLSLLSIEWLLRRTWGLR